MLINTGISLETSTLNIVILLYLGLPKVNKFILSLLQYLPARKLTWYGIKTLSEHFGNNCDLEMST